MRAITVHVNILEIGEHKGTLEQLGRYYFPSVKHLSFLYRFARFVNLSCGSCMRCQHAMRANDPHISLTTSQNVHANHVSSIII